MGLWAGIKKINSNMNKPINILLLEQTLAMQVSSSSIDWVFSQNDGVGQTLWYYGELWLHGGDGQFAVISQLPTITAVADSTVAMNAIASSSTAMNTIASSSTAMNAIAASSTAMNAIASSSTAMNAIASSSTAMNAIAASSTAMNAIASSSTAMNELYARKRTMKGAKAAKEGRFIILLISSDNAHGSGYGSAILSTGGDPNWSNYKAKFAYFMQYKTYVTYMRNDTESDDYIEYFDIDNP